MYTKRQISDTSIYSMEAYNEVLPNILPSQMEVCVDCIESAVRAEEGGASRLELCSALSEGGLTPSVGLLQVIKMLVKIPVFVMIRPRRGTDFSYSDKEVEVMELDIKSLKAAGADGFVFGALTTTRMVDESVCSRLLLAASPLPCTFHRAFDVVKDPFVALEAIVNLGFKRILTSGQRQSAQEGVELIRTLVEQSKTRISIMAGAGVTEKNLELILKASGVKEFHASARKPVCLLEPDTNSNVAMGTSDIDSSLLITDKNLVEQMVATSKLIFNKVL